MVLWISFVWLKILKFKMDPDSLKICEKSKKNSNNMLNVEHVFFTFRV